MFAELFCGESGWIASVKVITFQMDFGPSGFDRPVTKYFRACIVSKLARAGITDLTVTISRRPGHELILHFDGAAEDVAKARAAFPQISDPIRQP